MYVFKVYHFSQPEVPIHLPGAVADVFNGERDSGSINPPELDLIGDIIVHIISMTANL